MSNKEPLLQFTAAIVCLFVLKAVFAEDVSQVMPQVEEIVVSGFRDKSARNLNTSITVLNQDDIDSATVAHFEELVQLVPNINLSGEGSRARYFQLRGVGEREQYEGAPNPSIGFIVDDIDMSGVGGISSLFDVHQVDVLHGPQATRYGADAIAGLVYMQTAGPTEKLDARLELTGGNDDTRAIGGALGGPLGDSASGRLSLYHYASNGFRDNESLGEDDTNGRDELTVRGKLLWQLGEDWRVLFSGLYTDFDNGYDAFVIDNGSVMHSDNPGRDEQQTTAGSLKITGPLNSSAGFVSITGYASSDILFSFDGDWGSGSFWNPYLYDYTYQNPRDRDSLSQEFRLVSSPAGRVFNGSTNWVLGVYAQRLEEDNRIDSTGVYDDSEAEAICPPWPDPFACFTNRQVSSSYIADSFSVFGSLDSSVTARLGLSIGLRYEYWDAKYADSWSDISSSFLPGGITASNSFDPDEGMVGGHLALSYDWSDQVRGYTRIARGFKAGGFNPSLAALSGQVGPALISYEPEYLWNYELGLQGLWLDGSLSADLSAFYMDRDAAQLSQSVQQIPFDPNSFVFVTSNGKAQAYGLEASALWQVNDSWAFHGSLGLLQTEIDEYGVRPEAEGRDLAHAPPYTLNIGTTWSSPSGWYARLDINAIGSYYFDVSHEQKSGAYKLVNLKIGKKWEKWSVYLWGRNLFDKDYALRGFYFGNEPPVFADTLYTKFGDPRHYGITIEFRY